MSPSLQILLALSRFHGVSDNESANPEGWEILLNLGRRARVFPPQNCGSPIWVIRYKDFEKPPLQDTKLKSTKILRWVFERVFSKTMFTKVDCFGLRDPILKWDFFSINFFKDCEDIFNGSDKAGIFRTVQSSYLVSFAIFSPIKLAFN